MLMSVILIGASLGLSSVVFKQKQGQLGNQQLLLGRKLLTEDISTLQAAPWQYPFFVLRDSAVSNGGAMSGANLLSLSYVSCYDRAGNPVVNTQGSMKPLAVAVENRTVTQDSSCAASGEGSPIGFSVGAGGFGGGALGGRLGQSVQPTTCSAYSYSSTYTPSGFCAPPSAEFEVQLNPISLMVNWNGSYDVWVFSVLTEKQKQEKGVIRQFFREQVTIEQ
jgi:hypothetical protein